MANTQHVVCVLLLFASVALDLSSGQTFQYSRGWINGKRADPMMEQALTGERTEHLQHAADEDLTPSPLHSSSSGVADVS